MSKGCFFCGGKVNFEFVGKSKTYLIIGKVWPEPGSSAAGTRMMQLIVFFKKNNCRVVFASSANKTEHQVDLEKLGIECESIVLNDASFDDFVLKLNPEVVLFDRFTTEEQFGWRVANILPNTIRILNTEDLHFLRDARKNAIKNRIDLDVNNIRSEIAMRELAAIHRSDLSLFVSEFEIELLTKYYQTPINRTLYLPLFSEKKDDINSFENREGFMFIGNYFHEPNWDAVQVLKKEIWTRIKKELPDATISIYGGYAGQKVTDLHNEKDGFLVKGRVQDSSEVTKSHRVSLVPLRFGAGIKGKILEAMENGTPIVTTSIGAEAMMSRENCNGYIEDDFDAFARKAVELYLSQEKWLTSQEKGFKIIQDKFSKEQFEESFAKTLKELSENFLETRESDLQYNLFNHHSLKSSMYLSKWISEKNKA